MKGFWSGSPSHFTAAQWLLLIAAGAAVLYVVPRALSAATPATTR